MFCLISFCWSAFAQVDMEFGSVEASKGIRFVDFKMMRDGKKVPYYGLKPDDCRCFELVNGDTLELHIDSLVDISSRKLVSNNLTIVILADQGVLLSDADYLKLKEAIVSFVDALPEYVKVYITMMGTDVTETERVYAGESIRSYVRRDNMVDRSENEKSIYASIISKIQEIDNLDEDECFYPEIRHNKELGADTVSDKMLFVLSGKVEQDEDETFYRDKLLFNNPDYLTIPDKLKAIYCVYFGE